MSSSLNRALKPAQPQSKIEVNWIVVAGRRMQNRLAEILELDAILIEELEFEESAARTHKHAKERGTDWAVIFHAPAWDETYQAQVYKIREENPNHPIILLLDPVPAGTTQSGLGGMLERTYRIALITQLEQEVIYTAVGRARGLTKRQLAAA